MAQTTQMAHILAHKWPTFWPGWCGAYYGAYIANLPIEQDNIIVGQVTLDDVACHMPQGRHGTGRRGALGHAHAGSAPTVPCEGHGPAGRGTCPVTWHCGGVSGHVVTWSHACPVTWGPGAALHDVIRMACMAAFHEVIRNLVPVAIVEEEATILNVDVVGPRMLLRPIAHQLGAARG